MKIVAADIGGTHARFSIADLVPGEPPRMGEMRKYRTREHDGFVSTWAAFERDCGGALPPAASIGVAAPIEGDVLRFVNSGWVIRRSTLAAELGLDELLLLNDFGAVANAVSVLPSEDLERLCGPDIPFPRQGITTIIGPGTGLGVSVLLRRDNHLEVIETESAHIAFAPQTPEEERLETKVRARYGRCSVERIVSGPGLLEICSCLQRGTLEATDAGAVWTAAIDGTDPLAGRALDLLVGCFGAAAGDFSLAHGSMSIVVTGGLANRMKHRLKSPLFHARFTGKGRYRPRMERIPVFLSTYPEPGLLGAAVAFQRAFSGSAAPGPAA